MWLYTAWLVGGLLLLIHVRQKTRGPERQCSNATRTVRGDEVHVSGNVTVSMASRGHGGCSETRTVVVSVSAMQVAQARQLRGCNLESLTYAIVYLASQRVAQRVSLCAP